MKVVSIGTYDNLGGAARAAFRQHEALGRAGIDHWMLVGKKDSTDPKVIEAPPMPRSFVRSTKATLIRGFTIDKNRTPLSDTWFSFPLRDIGLAALDLVQSADIINIHWCSGLLSLNGLDEFLALRKPIVITCHDQWAYTGGCHYTSGCDGFLRDCSACPQLARDPVGVPATVHRLRSEIARTRRATVVSPSRWMHELASKAPAFAGWRCEHLPMPLDTDVFTPQPRDAALATLGLTPGPWRILFVAERVAEKRKGFDDLVHAASMIEPVAGRPVHFVAMGTPIELKGDLAQRVEFLGLLKDPAKIAAAYSAADAMILPSHEDNLPNTMLEALACGTPVVAYNVGGMPDLIRPGESGTLVPRGDIPALAGAVRHMLSSGQTQSLRESCRRIAEQIFSYPVHARRCIDLYEQLLASPLPPPSTPTTNYDAVLWDAAVKLLVDCLQIRPETTAAEREKILAGRMDLQRLVDIEAGRALSPGWKWTR